MSKRTGGFIGQDGLNAPDPATGVSASAGDAQVEVSFTAPSDVGGAAVSGYRVQSNDGIGASASASPITVTGLTNDTSYTFNVWAINPFGWSSPSDASGSVSPAAPIAVFGQGLTAQSVNISTTGNATSWGTTSYMTRQGAVSSKTRGIFTGGGGGGNRIEYATIPTGGAFADFGDLTTNATYYPCGSGNSTRGLFAYGTSSASNTIQYITIATAGNAIDFGDTPATRGYAASMGSSSTRALFAGGVNSGYAAQTSIYYATIATTGNAANFGNLTQARSDLAGASNATRGFCAGGYSGSIKNTIDYVTIATTGNATDFGDLSAATLNPCATAGATRGLIGSVGSTGGSENVIEYITLSSTGNSLDFGDLSPSINQGAAFSNDHGGLS